jgi:hypothetical protein
MSREAAIGWIREVVPDTQELTQAGPVTSQSRASALVDTSGNFW